MTGNGELKKAIDYIDEAIAITRLREASCSAFPLYASSLIQLDFIRNILLGTEKDKSRLHKLTIGAWAGKEFEETDPELAHALGIAYYPTASPWKAFTAHLPHIRSELIDVHRSAASLQQSLAVRFSRPRRADDEGVRSAVHHPCCDGRQRADFRGPGK